MRSFLIKPKAMKSFLIKPKAEPANRRQNSRIICAIMLAAFLAALAFAASCSATAPSGAPPALIKPVEAPADLVPVKREDIRPLKVAEGIIIPYSMGLSFRVTGAPILAVYVNHGMKVKEGDLLAELDAAGWQDRLDAANGELEHFNKVAAHEDKLADIWIESTQIAIDNAVDEQEKTYAEFNMREYKTRDDIRRETQKLERARMQTRIDALEEQRDGYFIYAPFDGQILEIEPLKPGDYPSGRAPFIYLGDLRRITVRCLTEQTSYFTTAESISAVIGDDIWAVKIIPYTLEEQLAFYYEGITPPARFGFTDLEDAPADAPIPPTDKRVLLIAYEISRENVLTIPINAAHIETASGEDGVVSRQDFAFADVNGVRERRDIKCGRRSDVKIEVIEGLREGELVYVD